MESDVAERRVERGPAPDRCDTCGAELLFGRDFWRHSECGAVEGRAENGASKEACQN